jgi:hypothetical protein
MRILIWTNHSLGCESVTRATQKNHFDYALKHGYDIMWANLGYGDLLASGPYLVSQQLAIYDAVFMLDADTLITNMDKKLEDICALGPDVIMCEENIGPHTRINAGIMMLNSTQNSLDFWKEIHDQKSVWETMPHVWQSYMDLHLERLPVTLVPARTFNSVVSRWTTYWEEGDFIAHFPGYPGVNPELEEFLKKYEV